MTDKHPDNRSVKQCVEDDLAIEDVLEFCSKHITKASIESGYPSVIDFFQVHSVHINFPKRQDLQ